MPLDVAGILQLFETGEMPEEEEEVEQVDTSSISIIENENVARQTLSTVLQKSDKPEEVPTPKPYKDIANTIKTGGKVDIDYSPEVIAQQLKDAIYPGKKVATPIQDVLGAYATFGVALTKIPRAVASSILQAMQGMEGAIDEDWADCFINDANDDIQKFAREAYMRFGDKGFAGIKITDLAELPSNVGYSGTSMLAGLAVGLPLSAVPLPGFRVGAWGAGTLASGAVAYRATTYQIMSQYLDIKNRESVSITGEGLTKSERIRLYNEFDEMAHKYGMWEAVPEAISNFAFGKILLTPLTKMVGKGIAAQIVGRLAGLYGEEFITETITQMGQKGIEVRAGMRGGKAPDWKSPTDWLNSFKEIAPQTFLLTTLMAGAGSTVITTAKAIKDIKKSLKREIGTGHVHYEGFIKKINEAAKEKVEPGTPYGEVPPVVTDKKVALDTANDISILDKLDREERSASAKLGKPYSATLYRGIQKTGPVDEGIYGKGTYYSPIREIAAEYIVDFGKGVGELIEKKITLKNPLRVNYAEIYAFADAALLNLGGAENYNKMIPSAQREFRSNAIRTLAERKGHDGILVTDYKGNVKEAVVFGRETALMIPERHAKRITAGEKPGVIVTEKELKRKAKLREKAIKREKVDVHIRSMNADSKVNPDIKERVIEERGLLANLSKGKQIWWAGNRLIENVAGLLDRTRPYGANWNTITGDINTAENTEEREVHSRTDALDNLLAQTYGEHKVAHPLNDERQVGKFNLTDANIMAVYMGSKDPQVVKHLKDGNGFTDAEIAECVKIFENDAKMQAVVNFGSESYREDYPLLAKVHMEQTGELLPERPFFMHIPVDFKQTVFERDNVVQQMMKRDQMGTHAYVSSNITKERVRSSRPIHLDYISNYLKYVSEAEHYKAYVGPIKNLTTLLSDERYRAAVKKKINNAALQSLDQYVKDVAGTSSRELKTMDHVMSALRQHTGIVQIGLNILSGFRQTLSALQATAEIGPYWMLHGIQRVMADYGGVRKIVDPRSAQIEFRGGMWERFIAEMKSKEKAVDVLTGRMTPRKLFMFLNSMFDRITVYAAAIGTYDRIISTGKLVDSKEHIPNADLERFAILEMERVSRKTQPHVLPKDLPGWHRGGTVAKMFTFYQNMSNKVVNYVDYDIIAKAREGQITKLRASEKFLFAVILPALLLGAIKRGRFPSLKEAALDIAKFPFHGMFLVGGMVSSVIDDYGEWSTPILKGPQAGVRAAKAVTRGDWVKAGKFTVETAAYAIGVPYGGPYRTYKGLLALMNDETDDLRRLIWSDYALTKDK